VTQPEPLPSDRPLHQIGEVADIVGLSLRTIRYYEEVDLVPASGRSSGGFRLYTDEDVERFRVVKAFKPLKFSLEQMRDLLALLDRVEHGTRLTAVETDRLAQYARAADDRAEVLRDQIAAVTRLSVLLHRTARASAARSKRA
jgi:DNA-binding transcriptional MerR regulator